MKRHFRITSTWVSGRLAVTYEIRRGQKGEWESGRVQDEELYEVLVALMGELGLPTPADVAVLRQAGAEVAREELGLDRDSTARGWAKFYERIQPFIREDEDVIDTLERVIAQAQGPFRAGFREVDDD